jgi:hypothetical protein
VIGLNLALVPVDIRTSMSDSVDLLAGLVQEERALSVRRPRLRERIDFLRATGSGDMDAERLARLEAEEREVSRLRRELHARIDGLRAGSGPEPAAAAAAKKEGLLEISRASA